MIRILLSTLLCSFLYVPTVSLGATQENTVPTPVKVVAAFQKLPDYEMYCQDESWGSAEPIKVGAKFEPYLSKVFYKLFSWSQCGQPKVPPRYNDLHHIFYWDIRFGSGQGYGGTYPATNIRIQLVKNQGADKAIVKVLFDPVAHPLKNITTTYTLIREDGHWKIDDIAPKGDFVEEGDQELFLEHSDSIKTDMRNNYRAAEERYQQEQAKKGAAPKP